MEFRLVFTPKIFSEKLNHQHQLLLIGSCFTENIGAKLKHVKFNVLENPHGILFNPISITTSLNSYIDNTHYTVDDLFYQNESWNSWDHHSRFSNPDVNICLQAINNSQQAAHDFLKKADWLMITVGSAFIYELQNNPTTGNSGRNNIKVVANCHKVPTDKFNKRLLNSTEILDQFKIVLNKLFNFNPTVKIIFTISPVRHLRDGFIENNRSKATLIQAIHPLVDTDDRLFYFPAYELVIDDLRDYRFYAEDMVHPNYSATNYVWEKFTSCCIDQTSQLLMKEINIINAAKNHKPFNPSSQAHKNFLKENLNRILKLKEGYPYIKIDEELLFFNNGIM